jgi:hypothetical protein
MLSRADPVGQLLQPLQLLISKNTGSVRKNFQDSGDLTIAVNRKNCDAADSCSSKNLGVHSGKFRDVLTEEWCSRIQALFGNTGVGVDRSAERRRSLARSRPANRPLLSPECDGRSARLSQKLGQFDDSIQKTLVIQAVR